MVKQTYFIDMEPIGLRGEIQAGMNLLDAARQLGVGLVSLCGGEGWCEGCLVRVEKGELTSATMAEEAVISPEDLKKGFRLACQAIPLSDVKIEIPAASLSTPQRLQVEGQEEEIEFEPAVVGIDVVCQVPTLHDLRSDYLRLQDALREKGHADVTCDIGVLSDLSDRLRQAKWNVRAVLCGNSIVCVLPSGCKYFGLAADIGTTKVAVYLIDLETGVTVEKAGIMNPQISYGEDVMSRISFSREKPEGRKILQTILVDSINELITNFCSQQSIIPDQIVDAVFVGNTAMHHLFAGLPVEYLGVSPCVPAVNQSMDIPAHSLGLEMAVEAKVHLLPNIAGYVGADHVAMLMATELWKMDGPAIGVDIGTNTEISLVYKGKIVSCSTASGPAFEGAHIRHGMRAAGGAIERVQISDGQVHIYTIDHKPAVGICGSGILDALAEMQNAGIVNEKGALQKDHPLVRMDGNIPEFVLVHPENTQNQKAISLTRKDINELQLAKSAIRVGIETLLEAAGVKSSELVAFVIAGAFGTYINIESAIKIGMFPDIPRDRFQQVGNAAGTGARQALISKSLRQTSAEVASQVAYIELTNHPEFQNRFLNHMYLPYRQVF
ncbi:MAG TPA: ASKHA domain-containing protein [Anaerolineales bacterium]|nr:ASKHA domain-containing protein [Anaerolineales bacterium]